MKKIMSLLLTVLMVFALATPVKASGYTIIIENENPGHTYEAYQIFTGDLDSTETILSNIKWADGVSLKPDLNITVNGETVTLTEASDVAKALNDKTLTLETLLTKLNLGAADAEDDFDDDKYELSGLTAGYYLVKDQDGSLTGDHDAYTDYIVKVVKSVTVKPKNVYPEVDKQVWDEDGDQDVNAKVDETGKKDNWGETADHNLNETFQFKLIADLPAETELNHEYKNYEEYKVVFTDTMSAGITFEKIVSVIVDGVTIDSTKYTCSATANHAGGSWTLTIADLLAIPDVNLANGAVIEVVYDAHLNEAAVIGNDDKNKNTVYLEYSNNPNAEGELGKTPEDHVWVFTYKVDGTKVDGASESKTEEGKYDTVLKDAEFVLYREGKNGNEYVKLDGNSKVTGWINVEDLATTIKSGEDGTFKIIGLDHGTYYLEEIKAPDGYNLLDNPIEITVTAQHREVDADNAVSLNAEHSPDVVVTVKNNKGAQLPETGGMGTTLFYTIGGLLFVAAAVLLISKKRMNDK